MKFKKEFRKGNLNAGSTLFCRSMVPHREWRDFLYRRHSGSKSLRATLAVLHGRFGKNDTRKRDDAEEEESEEFPEYNADTDSITAMFAQQTHVFDRAA